MEPNLPTPLRSSEIISPQSSEAPQSAGAFAERGPIGPGTERSETKGPSIDGDSPVASPPPQLTSLPGVLPVSDNASQVSQSLSTSPAIAADEDLVEKEWVDKAKKLVAQTKDDPYQQEKQVSKLQADYLKKRYGKDLKVDE